MKTSRTFTALVLALVGMLSSTSAATVDFTKIAGTYKAVYTLTSSPAFSGPVTVLATVSNQGTKAKLVIYGYANAGSSSLALYGVLVLGPHNQVSSNNVLLAYFTLYPPSNTHFTGVRSPLHFTLSSSSLPASIPYTLKFNGKRLSIVGTTTIGGSTYTVSVVGEK